MARDREQHRENERAVAETKAGGSRRDGKNRDMGGTQASPVNTHESSLLERTLRRDQENTGRHKTRDTNKTQGQRKGQQNIEEKEEEQHRQEKRHGTK
jgi:hypothetical protein